MPPIKVRNESTSSVKVGFFIFGMLHPSRWTNDLKPGGIFDGGDFPSLPVPQSFEVRRGGGAGAGFKDGDTLAHAAQMGTAGALGVAAVARGTMGVLNCSPGHIGAAGALWDAAHRGGAEYGTEVPESIKRVGLWVPWFSPLELVLRDGVDGIEVWCDGQKM